MINLTTLKTKAKAVGLTATGVVVGAMAGGPVGLAVGAALGGGIDFWRHKKAGGIASLPYAAVYSAPTGAAPAAATAGAVHATPTGLPPSANLAAASTIVHLLLLATPATVPAARGWLQQFQKSINLPATGVLDTQSRLALIKATAGGAYDAARLPVVTALSPAGGLAGKTIRAR